MFTGNRYRIQKNSEYLIHHQMTNFIQTVLKAIDKRNQNIIRSILEGAPPQNISEAEEKTRTFYRSCIKEREPIVSDDLINLQVISTRNVML